MKLGIVGSRRSNEKQKLLLLIILDVCYLFCQDIIDITLVSGGCYKGADKWVEEYAKTTKRKITIYKPKGTRPLDFHERNTEIVKNIDCLVATLPPNPNPKRFAGTEQTVREAIQKKLPVILIDFEGKFHKYNVD